jgi:tRNA(Ile)-lysidine synthase
LVRAQSGKQVFSNTHRLVKDRDALLLTEISSKTTKNEFFISENEKEITHPIHLKFNDTKEMGNSTISEVYIDRAKITYPLQLRKWREGDVFQPFGMKGKKKLSKFFKDEKLSLVAKENCWVLCSDAKIVWLVGLRLDDRFKISPETKQIIKITRIP